MNAYNSYACKGNVTAARKRQTSVLLRLLRAVFLTVCERITLRGLRVTATLVSFFAALGFIGGMECGVISGAEAGRTDASDITIFDSTGIALQDIATAAALLQAAQETGKGQTVTL